MRELILYEPGRKPADWNETLSPDERAVFFVDVSTGAVRDADGRAWRRGRPDSCLLFDNAKAARAYCLERVAQFPDLRCEIFDSRGRAVLPSEIIVNERYRHQLSAPRNRRLLVIAAVLLLIACAALLYLEYRFRGGLIVAMIVGMNCFGVALRLLFLATSYPEESEAVSGN